jgi:tol-pal system protein YbgF
MPVERSTLVIRARSFARVALLCLATGGAQAGLFDDEEARKAILDLRARIQASEDAGRARLGDVKQAQTVQLDQLQEQLRDQTQQLRRGLLDLSTQLDLERADNAKLRGTQEQLARDLAELQRSFKDLAKSLDDRLRTIEPQKVVFDGKEFLAEPDEKRGHDQAMAALRGGDFDKAVAALSNFVQRYPASGYADSARFWLGNALYGQRSYKEAIAVFRAFVTAVPAHPRAPEALLALANCQIEMKDNRAARKTIEELVKAYPASEAAAAGKERLASLKG